MKGLGRFAAEAARAVRNNRFEKTEDGRIHVPAAGLFIGGVFRAQYAAPGEDFGPPHLGGNRVVNQGLDKILNLLAGHTQSSALYVAPFAGDVAPAPNWTGANWKDLATEFTAYSPGTRPPWTTVASNARALTNAAALAAATITFNTGGPYTIRGAVLCEASAKGATTGALIAATRFDADLAGMVGGGKLALQYDLQAMDESDA